MCVQTPSPEDERFLRELSSMADHEETPEAVEVDLLVTVRRQWNDCRTVDVPLNDLWDFHWRQVSGGVEQRLPRPFLHARMWCSSIPEGSDFPHSCLHGPPPHAILVCVCKTDNREVFDRLCEVSWNSPS